MWSLNKKILIAEVSLCFDRSLGYKTNKQKRTSVAELAVTVRDQGSSDRHFV